MDRRMEFRALGPLAVSQGDRLLALGGPKQRVLLALLVIHANEVVSADRLADELWGDDPPADPGGTMQVYVSNLRKRLEPDRGRTAPPELLLTRAPGYVLQVEPSQVDALRFAELVAGGRGALARHAPDEAAATLRQALDLWRGPALADLADHPFAHAFVARLDEARVSALEDLYDAELALGRHAESVEALQSLVAEHPVRERLRGQLMLALYRGGRQAEALAAYQDARSVLVEGLGIDPGPDLQRIESGDPQAGGRPRRPGGRLPAGGTAVAAAATAAHARGRSALVGPAVRRPVGGDGDDARRLEAGCHRRTPGGGGGRGARDRQEPPHQRGGSRDAR